MIYRQDPRSKQCAGISKCCILCLTLVSKNLSWTIFPFLWFPQIKNEPHGDTSRPLFHVFFNR